MQKKEKPFTKMSTAVASSKSTGKSKSGKASKNDKAVRPSSPVADLEYNDPADDVPDQTVEDDTPDTKLIDRIRQVSSDIFKLTNRPATNVEISEVLDEEVSTIKAARDALKNARKRQRLSTLRRKALQVGYSRRKGLTRAEAQGLDMDRTLFSPHDIKRMMRSIPLTFENGTYSMDELKMKLELAFESMPVNVAREIIAFLEPIFRSIMNECVERLVRNRTQRITPAIVYSVLKKYNGLGLFTGVLPPKGLVKYCKQDGLEPRNRAKPEEGTLMTASKEDKKEWRSEKAKNQEMAELYEKMVEMEKARMEKKKKREDKKEEETAEAAGASEEADAGSVTRPKKAKKSKKQAA